MAGTPYNTGVRSVEIVDDDTAWPAIYDRAPVSRGPAP
jgi:hypothetical protein